MKKAELIQRVLNGEMITGVEYRGATYSYFAANAEKQSAATVVIKHRIELKDGKQQEVAQYLSDEELAKHKDLEVYAEKMNNGPLPFKKGTIVLWHIRSYAWTQRGQKATGTIEALED